MESGLILVRLCIFEQEGESRIEVAGFAGAGSVHEAEGRIIWVKFSCRADVVGGGAVILPDEAEVSKEAQDFDFLVWSQGDEFTAFLEEFYRVDVFVLLGEGDGHVRACGEKIGVNLEGIFEIDAGIGEGILCHKIDAAFKEASYAQDIRS